MINDKPTKEIYYPDGTIRYQLWKKNDKQHRDNDMPAYISYYKNGTISYQSWWKNGNRHRTNDLPAWISYYSNGSIESQHWYENGNILSDKKVLSRQYQWFNKVINNIDRKGIKL